LLRAVVVALPNTPVVAVVAGSLKVCLAGRVFIRSRLVLAVPVRLAPLQLMALTLCVGLRQRAVGAAVTISAVQGRLAVLVVGVALTLARVVQPLLLYRKGSRAATVHNITLVVAVVVAAGALRRWALTLLQGLAGVQATGAQDS